MLQCIALHDSLAFAFRKAWRKLELCMRMVSCMEHAVTQFVEAPPYKPEGPGFSALWPWVYSASDRNEYEEYFLGGGGV
jgi:hypothetical protein